MGPFRLAVILCAIAASTAQAAGSERGETLIRRHCGTCHAPGPQGTSPEPAAPPLRELNRRYDPEMLSEALGEGLLTGHPLMPEFRFEPEDVEAILQYLRAIQTRQPAGNPGVPTGAR
ncbi:MAG: cytochrome c [Phenylobacterium sp.]|nr:cytochrome c [Phenylobacterium sp.]